MNSRKALVRRPMRGLALPESAGAALLAGQLSKNTARAYRDDLRHFAAWLLEAAGLDLSLGDNTLAGITRDHVTAYRQAMIAAGAAAATINHRLSCVRSLLREAEQRSIVARNVGLGVKGVKEARLFSPTQGLTAEQARRLLDACAGRGLAERRDRALLEVMLRTGLRVGEVVGLRVEDLGEHDGHRTLDVLHAKGGQHRRAKLTEPAWQSLSAWLQAAKIASGPLFRAVHRGPRRRWRLGPEKPLCKQAVWYLLRRRCAQAGIEGKISPHSLRHTFITLALAGGAPLHKAQYAAGHADPRTTERYDRRREDLEDNAADYLRI